MTKNKYLSIFLHQMEAIVFIIVIVATLDVLRFLLLVWVVEDPDPNRFHPPFLSH